MEKQGTSIGWAYMLLSMMLIGFALTLIGCKGKEIVTETVKTEYLIKEVHDTMWMERLVYIIDSTRQATSVHERDCTVVRQDAQGNVIGTDRWHSRDTSKELSHSKEKFDSVAYYRSIVDSLRRIKNDSTRNTVYAKSELSFRDKLKQTLCGAAMAVVIVAAAIIFRTWYGKRKDRLNI